MSGKSAKKTKKTTTPRTMAEIQASYNQLCANAGQIQYQVNILTRELTKVNTDIELVNREGAARQELDRSAAAQAASQSANQAATTETAQQAGA